MTDRLKYETVSEAGNDSEFNFHFHIHKLNLSGWQVSSYLFFTRSREFLQDLARFEKLARAQGPAEPSDLVHFVVKSVVEKVDSERIFFLVFL